MEWRVTLVRTALMPSPDAAARHTGAGVARRQAHHERMRDERAREAAAGDAELPPEDDAVEMASAVHVLDSVAEVGPNYTLLRSKETNTWKPPGIPGKYPATAWVSCRFPQFCVRFCPRPALRLRETREFPEWSTKHPLFSLEISGNAKCWGPSVFLFVCRKSICRPIASPGGLLVILATICGRPG